MQDWLWWHKYSLLPPIKKNQGQKTLKIHPYAKLDEVSKGFYINFYQFNCYSKLSVSFNELKCKDTIQYHHGQTLNHGKRWITDVSRIRSITLLINGIIENSHREGMKKNFKYHIRWFEHFSKITLRLSLIFRWRYTYQYINDVFWGSNQLRCTWFRLLILLWIQKEVPYVHMLFT